MLQCVHGNEAVVGDGDSMPFFGGLGTPLSTTTQFGRVAERHKVGVLTIIAQNTLDTQASNHEFITFGRGMKCATCK